ncbi:hemagglutinin repeat-containing protein [Pseudomonas fildesensis]
MANTRTKSSSEYTAQTAHQSNLNAGGKLSIIAAGDAPGTVGDLTITGSTLKADSTLLSAKNNILMHSAQNTTDRKNDGSRNRTAIGASFNIGEQNGFTIDLGAQTAKNLGSGGSVTQVNTTLDTGSLVLRSGQDTSLIGAQVRADRIDADVGGNLNILSRQDTETSKSKQNSAGFGASICIPPICYGSPVTASANLAASKMNSDYQAVTDQSGFFAGKGGYTIDVAKNTTLQGAVIASEATADKNLLLTDRLLVSDIKNKSEIESKSAGMSVSGSYSSGASTLTPGALYGMALNDSDHSYTRSAVSEGTIVVRNPEGANDLVGLNRDTANANQRLDKPDEKAMQERMELVKSSMELTKGIGDAIAAARIRAANDSDSDVSKATRLKLIDEGIANPTQAQISQRAQQDYGVGSSFQKASQAVTAVVQAAMGDSVGGALAGAAAPYLAQTVKKMTDGDPKANLMAHAVLGAVLARAGGNSALAGAAGAVAAEKTAQLIKESLYGGVSNENLSEGQKQTISSLSTLAAGLSGSLVGKDALNAVAAAQVGKNAVENNYLSVPEATRKFVLSRKQVLGTITDKEKDELAYINVTDKDRDEAIRGVCTAGNLSSTACSNLIAPAQKALAEYGENVAYNLLYKDLYRVDAANAEAALRGLDAGSILHDITINNLAKDSDKTRAEVEEQYDTVMAMHAIMVAFASAYGLKGGLTTSLPKDVIPGPKATPSGLVSGETKVVGSGESAANDANFGAKATGEVGPSTAKGVDVVASQGPKELQLLPDFSNGRKTFEHYAKHSQGVILGGKGKATAKPDGADVPEFTSLDSYVSAARSFWSPAARGGVMQGTRADGSMLRFEPSTGYFGVMRGGKINTFFRPGGDAAAQLKYFKDQL